MEMNANEMEPNGNTPLAQQTGAPKDNYEQAGLGGLEGVRQNLIRKIDKLFAELDKTPMSKNKATEVITPIIMYFIQRYKLKPTILNTLLHNVKDQLSQAQAPPPMVASPMNPAVNPANLTGQQPPNIPNNGMMMQM